VYWAVDAQYSFGWFWASDLRLSPFYSLDHSAPDWTRALSTPARAKWVFWIACLAFLPTWLVEQPNPDWRLIVIFGYATSQKPKAHCVARWRNLSGLSTRLCDGRNRD
jgi:hypothetical protein